MGIRSFVETELWVQILREIYFILADFYSAFGNKPYGTDKKMHFQI